MIPIYVIYQSKTFETLKQYIYDFQKDANHLSVLYGSIDSFQTIVLYFLLFNYQ